MPLGRWLFGLVAIVSAAAYSLAPCPRNAPKLSRMPSRLMRGMLRNSPARMRFE